MTPSRSQSTVEAYRRRVEQLRRQAARSLGYPDACSVPPVALVEYLVGRKEASSIWQETACGYPAGKRARQQPRQALARATWRQYKGALLFVLEQDRAAATEGVVVEELDIAIRRLRPESQSGCLKRSVRTSGAKLKAMPATDFELITSYLASQVGRQRHANTLLTWLRANQLVGLRPSEWARSGLIEVDGTPALRVANAKQTNGRTNGAHRTLLLGQLTPAEIERIDDMLYMLVEMEKEPGYDFRQHMNQLRVYMHAVTRRCLGTRTRYPSLYSSRHQFVADAKADRRNPDEIAALVGHGSDATAATHYGRTAKGNARNIKVSALPSEMATVRNRRKASPHLSRRADR
jgi:integrase